MVLKSNTPNFAMVTEIQLLLFHASSKEIHANLCCAKGHFGVVGNEKADTSAKCAASSVDGQAAESILHTDMT